VEPNRPLRGSLDGTGSVYPVWQKKQPQTNPGAIGGAVPNEALLIFQPCCPLLVLSRM